MCAERFNAFVTRFVAGIAALGAVPAADALADSPVLDFETTLALPGSFARGPLPLAVTVSDRGEVCVTDATSNAGLLFNPHGVFTFATGPLADLANPQDIAVDLSGEFVCTDSRSQGDRTIRRLNFYGMPVAFDPEPPIEAWQPHHLVITRDGHYVTVDQQNGLLAKHHSGTGALLWTRDLKGEDGEEILGLGRPAEGPDGRLFMPLGNERRVLVLSADGATESAFGTPGTGRGRFAFPVGAAWCERGSVAVLDRMRGTILLFTPEGQFEGEFGRMGSRPGALYQPVAIASSTDGRVYVAQGFESRVQVFRFVEDKSSRVIGDQPTGAIAEAGGAGSDEGRALSAGFSTFTGSSDLSGNDEPSESHWIQTESIR